MIQKMICYLHREEKKNCAVSGLMNTWMDEQNWFTNQGFNCSHKVLEVACVQYKQG